MHVCLFTHQGTQCNYQLHSIGTDNVVKTSVRGRWLQLRARVTAANDDVISG